MRKFAFFLCLLFLLPFGNAAGAKASAQPGNSSRQEAITALPFELVQIDRARFSGSNSSEVEKILYSEDVDDDDDDDTSEGASKKYRSAATIQPAPYSHPVLDYHHCVTETLPASFNKLSCRYILHGTFKI